MPAARDRKLLTLYLFYGVFFISMGVSTYVPKYYGEIGLRDSQIGLISAVSAVAGILLQPVWGMLGDRARYKRTVVGAGLFLSGVMCFLIAPARVGFFPLLIVVTLCSIFQLPAIPVGNAISIEYTSATGHSFGPVRMMGTVGYQVGILVIGFILVTSLHDLYPIMGVTLLLTSVTAFLLPPVRGYQRREKKLSLAPLLGNRSMLILFAVAFIGHIGHQFSLVFFTKHLGDLGVDNAVTGMITAFSVILEIPFLFFGDRIMKRFSIWTWLLIGMFAGSARFILLSFLRSPVWIVLTQMLSIAHLACFEFFPAIHMARVTQKELQASNQSLYQMITFGFARIAASLIGGGVSDMLGIPTAFLSCGIVMGVAGLVSIVPLSRLRRADASSVQE